MHRTLALSSLVFLLGCGGSDAAESNDAPPPPPPSAERPSLSAAECEAQGGTVVGDIGDGRIHRPDYRCDDGQPPVAEVPLGVEGSVCCAGSAGDSTEAPPEGAACAVSDACREIQCFRAVTCVRECGDEPVGCGCCPCADGFVDAIECDADR